MKLRLGISPCPNDTFTFHAIMERKIDLQGLDLEIELLDIEQLNTGLEAGDFDFAKGSFAKGLSLAGKYGVLRAGSALGFGVGPLLLSDRDRPPPGPDDLILCPGAGTTATLLLRCLYPHARRIEHRLFSDIMPALARGEGAYGVVIHEGRFTYQKSGLHLVRDLGEAWETETGGAIPLGGIFAKLEHDGDVARRLNRAVAHSIDYAWANKNEAFKTMQRHAQEFEAAVVWSHVDIYVNEYTRDLGEVGERTLAALAERARKAGILAQDAPALKIIG